MRLVLMMAVLGACHASPSERCGPAQATVKSVIDGDTIVLDDDEHVRYILVDTNEITNGHNDCYGQEAKLYNAALVEGKVVDLAYDQDCTDRFGRLLAYVSIQGREVNRLLIERGYGCVLYIPPDGAAKRADYQAAEDEARAAMRGMWGACQVVACAQ